ncbi:hypothetical protein Agabi119p4_11525 [Agaricus bisporus var. burnettii]|uniref:Uncharacterized protein n=1 Tax=Agaricus bisporus var. burnettii TaxID=192524 RepID=A0A8H7C0G7_AGABI|nr:hypothetical protein Agabi119p4_11525 [Agaricus bisporus var. burnettii]
MSNAPSPPSQDSCELLMDPDRYIEEAKEIFREARADKANVRKFKRLLRTPGRTNNSELVACIKPSFQKLASLVAGRLDLALPGSEYFATFDILLDRRLLNHDRDDELSDEEGSPEERGIRWLIDYIHTEVENDNKLRSKRWTDVPLSVQEAWETDYVGETDKLLREAVFSMYRGSQSKPYGNFCALIQGSGTGKSRVVDKLAEFIFTIPIVLRPLSDTRGFPLGDFTAPDMALVEFFCPTKTFTSALHAQLSYLQFLLKTLAIADKWIDDYKASGHEIENIAAEWRKHLGGPRTPHRRDMYSKAIGTSTLKGFENILDETVDFDVLQKCVKRFISEITQKIKPQAGGEPIMLFYFDEAQNLSAFTVTKEETELRWTAYQCLCNAFTYMLNVPVFALFLSTNPQLTESSPSGRNFWSSRLLSSTSKESDDNSNAPFVELPFDTWKVPTIVAEGEHSGDEICSLRFMARFGRPMFWAIFETIEFPDNDCSASVSELIELATSKLTFNLEDHAGIQTSTYLFHKLIPLLAARVDMTFESNRDEAVTLEALLVAKSMHTVYLIPQHRQYLRGGYPSEPFLAEVAARAMLTYFHGLLPKRDRGDIAAIIAKYKDVVPEAVFAWFYQGLIDKGTRGELVARMLCTLAHDISILNKVTPAEELQDVSFSQMVPVLDFFHTLIAEEHAEKFLKHNQQTRQGSPSRKFLHMLMSTLRNLGAAIQGYGTMRGVDLIIPIWIRGDGNPDRWSMTAIFVQLKNKTAKQNIQIDVQKDYNFFTGGHKRPYITIVMQLGLTNKTENKDPVVEVSPPRLEEIRNNQGMDPLHSRYEIFVTGCSNEAYGVISGTRDTYSSFFADKDIFAEHPRAGKFLAAAKRMKPYWATDSYDWATMKKEALPGELLY